MISGTPLFRGRDNQDQLLHIMRVIGTPTDEQFKKMAKDSVSPRLSDVILHAIDSLDSFLSPKYKLKRSSALSQCLCNKSYPKHPETVRRKVSANYDTKFML